MSLLTPKNIYIGCVQLIHVLPICGKMEPNMLDMFLQLHYQEHNLMEPEIHTIRPLVFGVRWNCRMPIKVY